MVKTIVIDPDASHLVIKVFQLYASGNHSLNTIVLEMNKLGLRTASGQHLLSAKLREY